MHPIEIDRLVYRYRRAKRPAVDGLTLHVASGEIVGLLGPNGAGKTTTLHAILGLLRPATGSVRVLGRDPVRERTQVLPHINFASVDVDLPSNLLVGECVRVYAALYGVRPDSPPVRRLMERFDLGPFERQRVGTLSAGEHMRLKLCKALLNEPEALILDEPTLSLDPYRAEQTRRLLRDIQRERKLAILHTSHNMREVELFCDRIVFLHQGRSLAEGSPGEVLNRFKSRSLEELFIRVAASGELWADEEDEP